MKKSYLATCAGLLAAALLAATPGAAALTAPKAGDACFKRVYEKTTGNGRWLVKECVVEASLFFEVDFRDAKLQQYKTSIRVDGQEMSSGDNYTIVAPDTLSIDLMSERGGVVYLVRPVSDSKELSSVGIDYMNPDEGGIFTLKKVGNTIRLKTSFDDVTVPIDSDGRFGKVSKAKVPQKK